MPRRDRLDIGAVASVVAGTGPTFVCLVVRDVLSAHPFLVTSHDAMTIAGDFVPWERLFALSATAMWLSEGEPDGPVVGVNAAMCQLVGMSVEQVTSQGLAGLFEDLTGVQPEGVQSGQSPRLGRVGISDQSTTTGRRWLAATYTRVDGSSCSLVLVEVHDTYTGLEPAEKTARSQAFSDAVLSAVPDAVSILTMENRRTTWASRSLEEVLGYAPGEVQQLQAGGIELGHPDDTDKIDAAFTALMDCPDGQVVNTVSRVRHADGTWHVLSRRSTPFRRNEKGAVTEVINVARDVTEQEALTAEIDTVRGFQQAIIAASPDLIYIKELTSGRPTWTSRDPDSMLGYPPQSQAAGLLGPSTLLRWAHVEDIERLLAQHAELLDVPDGAVLTARYRARHADGGWRWLSRRMTPFTRDGAGRITHALAV